MSSFVVDTNVPVVANGKSDQAKERCVLACIAALEQVHDGTLVLDDRQLILKEYMRKLRMSGQPGPGDAFLKWAWSVQATPKCERVAITPAGNSFREFPDDPELAGFHDDDRKFVAVALGSSANPEVLNAVDADWWRFREALKRNGVRVRFLCPEQWRPGPKKV
jgi:hypothetical protein